MRKPLKYDSIHGKFNAEISFDDEHIIINKKENFFRTRDRFKKY